MNTGSKGTALITGASSGIGAIYADRLASRGHDLILVARNQERLHALATRLTDDTGRSVEVIVADLTKKADLARVEQVLRTDASITLLVNNAGTTNVQQIETMPFDVWDRIIKINLTGTFYCCRAAIPHLKRRPGAAIVNMSSSSALVGGGGGGHYAASKAGIDGLTRHLARELAPGIRVNSIQPRTIDTDLFQARYAHAPLEQEKVMNQIPLRRVGQPEDVADAVAFLASDWASFITGQILLIDGGRTYQ